ncbi:MAG: beta-ureidopropionase [Ignavibacteria bacterium]|nr:beta-ureidopropionase [Ignavibacteria bacterium]
MKTGLLQFRPVLAEPEQNIERVGELLAPLDFDLIVLPELSNSGYFFRSAEELDRSAEDIGGGMFVNSLREIAQRKGSYIVSGVCERSGGRFYNTSVLIHPNGRMDVYRKIHLFDTEKKWFTPGDKPPGVFEVKGSFGNVLIGMMICFDWFFPETARTLALQGAQIICHPSNLVLSYCQKAMYARAVENRVFTVTANRTGTELCGDNSLTFTGQSVMVSPKGEYLISMNEFDEGSALVEIDPQTALDKNVTAGNNLFKDRRSELYKL